MTFKDTSEIASDFSRAGSGISDEFRLAARLSQLFFYTNSFFRRYPVLDLCAPPAEAIGQFDFVVCSEVLEHIPAPVDRALDGLRSLLKRDGFAVTSVPTRPVLEESGLCRGGVPEADQTIECCADLVDWSIEDGYLTWRDISGQLHIDENPKFTVDRARRSPFDFGQYLILHDDSITLDSHLLAHRHGFPILRAARST